MKLDSVPPSQSLDSCNFLWFHLLCSFRFEQIFVLETIFLSIFHCSFFLLLRNGNIYPSAYPATRIRIIIPKTCSKLFSVHYFSVFTGDCAFIKNARIYKTEKLPLGNIDLRKIQYAQQITVGCFLLPYFTRLILNAENYQKQRRIQKHRWIQNLSSICNGILGKNT